MTIAQSDLVALRYVEETTYGTTPSSALQELRYTTESLSHTKDTGASAEVIAERRVREVLELGRTVEGDIEFELSYSNLADLFEGAFMSSWQLDTPSSGTDRLEDGSTLKSYTFEKEYTDLTTPEFHSFTGCRIGGLSLSVEPGSPITGSISVLGQSGAMAESTVGTGAATAAPTNEVMVVGADVSEIAEGGSAATDVLGFSFDLDNALRNQRNITSLDPHNIGAGRLGVTGSVRFYFQDSTEVDKFLNFTSSSLKLTVADSDANQYIFEFPSVKYTAGPIEHSGNEGDAILNLSWEAFKDSSAGIVARIDRS